MDIVTWLKNLKLLKMVTWFNFNKNRIFHSYIGIKYKQWKSFSDQLNL